jgi:hypothetical protein
VARAGSANIGLTLDAQQYGLGQPVAATVRVENNSSVPLAIPALDCGTLTFYWGREGEAGRAKGWPVLPKDVKPEPRLIQPGGVEERSFLFTQATTTPGKWGMIVALTNCFSDDEAVRINQPMFSAPVRFQVSDQVKFKRDPYSGIIVKEQALELARAQAKAGGDAPARAVLVPLGTSGLVMWTVTFGAKDAPGEQKTFTVSPYTGEVAPFQSQEGKGEKQ